MDDVFDFPIVTNKNYSLILDSDFDAFEKCESAGLDDSTGNQCGGTAGGVYFAGSLATQSIRPGKLGGDRCRRGRHCVCHRWASDFSESNGTNDKRQEAGKTPCFFQ